MLLNATSDFRNRLHASEQMDEPCTYEQFRSALRDLNQINLLTFGYRPTLQWLKDTLRSISRPVHILDFGSGGGDMLRRVRRWALRNRIDVQLTGIDLNPYALQAAREFSKPGEDITWVTGNAFSYQPERPIDIIISSLVAHHLSDAELVHFLHWMDNTARLGWFVNDLHREPVPYHLYRLLTWLTGWRSFVKQDGLTSIRRSFQPDDWRDLCAAAAVDHYVIQKFRPGRLCVWSRRNTVA